MLDLPASGLAALQIACCMQHDVYTDTGAPGESKVGGLQQWLVNALHSMSAEHFEWATSIMLAHEPKLAEQLGEQEISPDMDTFNALTLRQLQWLAKSHPPTGQGFSDF